MRERWILRSLQQTAQVYFDVARIGAQRFFGCCPAEAGRGQILK